MTKEIDIDQILWKGIRNGDEDAFQSLYSKYIEHLYFFGSRYCLDKTVLEDCIQDLFTDLFYYRNRLSPVDNVRYYLYRSLQRNLIRVITKKRKNDLMHKEQDYQFHFEYTIEDEWIDGEEKLKIFNAVKHELDSLPKKQREVLYLRFTESLSYEEIANLTNIKVQSVRMQVYRAIKTIRKNVEELTKRPEMPFLFFISCLFRGYKIHKNDKK